MRFSLIALFMMCTAANAVDCSTAPDRTQTQWRYRIVDGKECWYRHLLALPKSSLQWAPYSEAVVAAPNQLFVFDEMLHPVYVPTVSYRKPMETPPEVRTSALVAVLAAFMCAICGMLWIATRPPA